MIETKFRTLLAQETGHLDASARQLVQQMTGTALALLGRCPRAGADAVADKLLTLYPGSERWVRVLVAKAALETVGPTAPTALAA